VSHFAQLRYLYLRKDIEKLQHAGAVLERSKCQCGDDRGMDHDPAFVQKFTKGVIFGAPPS